MTETPTTYECGEAITRAEALAISHNTLETAEAERNASDANAAADTTLTSYGRVVYDTVVALVEENARLKAELAEVRGRLRESDEHCMS